MPLVSVQTLQPVYDVIVVGSGAGGAQAAYTLCLGGAKVLMLEGGRHYDAAKETPMFQSGAEAPLRGVSTPDKPRGFFNASPNGGWTLEGEPYGQQGDNFSWWRARVLGGRTHNWERICLRFGPYDFKSATRDGLGLDWPVSYEDLAPYYDKVERLIGVFGDAEGIENSPDSPPGVLLPPPALRLGERLAQKRAESLGIRVVPVHRAVLTRRLDARGVAPLLHPENPTAQALTAAAMEARSPCFWATDCDRGCAIQAAYQSTTVHLPPALASGNLDLLCGARARLVARGEDGRATGIHFIDTETGTDHFVRGRAVMLAASAFESVRLLMNSGLGQSSGQLGRHVTNTVGHSVSAQIPLLENLPPLHEDGAGGSHAYAPWWGHATQRDGRLDFARGYHLEMGTGRRLPDVHTGAGLQDLTGGSYGRAFKKDARRYFGSFIWLSGRGEMVPNDRTFAEIDPSLRDRWGVPCLRVNWHWSEQEIRQSRHMIETFSSLITAMGGKVRGKLPEPAAIRPVTHEVGGAVMGSDQSRSVTDPFGRLWDTPNVWVADAATFCSNPDKNPTLTQMALSWRAADDVLRRFRRGEA